MNLFNRLTALLLNQLFSNLNAFRNLDMRPQVTA